MNRICQISVLMLAMNLGYFAHAEETGLESWGDGHTQLDPDETHPLYPAASSWATSLIIGAGGLFIAAMVIGPLVRAEAPDAVPAAISHEEDPAVDRH